MESERKHDHFRNETCGKPIPNGRSNKTFCDGYCRTEQNKRKSKRAAAAAAEVITATEISLTSFIHGINDKSANNRRILDGCLGDKETRSVKTREID